MAPLWDPAEIRRQITSGPIFQNLGPQRSAEIAAFSEEELDAGLTAALSRPQLPHLPSGALVRRAVYSAQYAELFARFDLPSTLAVYEPGAGASDSVTVAVEAHTWGKGCYATVNLNRALRAQFQSKTAYLRLAIDIVEDRAEHSRTHFSPNSFDAACFHHAVNDILQTAVSEPRGMDTTTVDWWPNERQMIEWLAEDFAADGLESRGRPELLEVVSGAVDLVRPGGYLIFDHWTSLSSRDSDWFPWDLFCDLIPMARRWIATSDLPLIEIELPGADPRWWMIMQVEK